MISIESVTWNNRVIWEDIYGIIGEDQWHNRLHLAALEKGKIGLLFSIMWKSLHTMLCTSLAT